MTDHEMLLLRAAVEATPDANVEIGYTGRTWYALHCGGHPTLADALTALLADLGADVPEWPDEGRVATLYRYRQWDQEQIAALTLPDLLALWGGS